MSAALQSLKKLFRRKSRSNDEDEEWIEEEYYDAEANGPLVTTAHRLEQATNAANQKPNDPPSPAPTPLPRPQSPTPSEKSSTTSRKSSRVPSRSGVTDIPVSDWEYALPTRQAPFPISPNSTLVGFTSRGIPENVPRSLPRPRIFRSRFAPNRSEFQVRHRPEPQRFIHVTEPFLVVLDSFSPTDRYYTATAMFNESMWR